MKFEKLTKAILFKLKEQGYNTVIHNRNISGICITWFPESIENIYDYIASLCSLGAIVYEKPNILVIDDGIENISEEYLVGYVFVGGYN